MSLSTRLNFEELGARIMPSVSRPQYLPASTPAAIRPSHYALEGVGTGTVAATTAARQLTGAMTTADLGRVVLSGSILTGSIGQRTTGTLTFTNARGSMTIRLTGLTPNSAANEQPKYFRYEIVSGTGDHAHWRQQGTARIDVSPAVGFRIVI